MFRKEEIQSAPITQQTEEEKLLDLRLIPHSDNDTFVHLEVLNLGHSPVDITAQLRLVGKSPSGLFKKLPFTGLWKSELNVGVFYDEGRAYVRSVSLEPNIGQLLTIAGLTTKAGDWEQVMRMIGIDKELIAWHL